MLTATRKVFAGALFGLAACFSGEEAQAQFQPPANSLALDEEGTLEGMQGNVIKFRDSKQEVWLLQLNGQTKFNVTGEADATYLRPGLTVTLTGTIGEDASITEPVTELEVLPGKSRQPMGLFDPTDTDEDAKPVRNPSSGEYRVRGRLVKAKDGALEIAAGRLKIAATAADDLKVVLAVDDVSLAQVGDKTRIKAWYVDGSKPNPLLNRPGQALAEEVDITLTNPPPSGKRGR